MVTHLKQIRSVHRAEEVDLVLELEGLHKKEINGKMSGSVRVLLKTEDDRDQICISDAIWDPEQMPLGKQVGWETITNLVQSLYR